MATHNSQSCCGALEVSNFPRASNEAAKTFTRGVISSLKTAGRALAYGFIYTNDAPFYVNAGWQANRIWKNGRTGNLLSCVTLAVGDVRSAAKKPAKKKATRRTTRRSA